QLGAPATLIVGPGGILVLSIIFQFPPSVLCLLLHHSITSTRPQCNPTDDNTCLQTIPHCLLKKALQKAPSNTS
ncbi:hypothetical protein PMAYCL1PPCAC_15461, partial [Pristionchus mayeri]